METKLSDSTPSGWSRAYTRYAKKHATSIGGLVCSLLVLTYLVATYDFVQVAGHTSQISLYAFGAVFTFLVLNVFASCIRFSQVVKDFGADVPILVSFRSALYGTVSGLFAFQFIGQTITRALLLKQVGIPSSSIIVMSLYERLIAFGVLFIAALVGSVALFHGITINLADGGFELVRLTAALSLALGATFVFAIRSGLIDLRNEHLRLDLLIKFLRTVGITLTAHVTMIASYTIIAYAIAPDVPVYKLAAASAIVSFVAALPISFSGWGVRELSAVYAYSSLGLGPEQALAVSLIIGVVSILSLFTVIGGMNVGYHHQLKLKPAQISTDAQSLLHAIGDKLNIIIPIVVAALVMFQIRLPLGSSEINVNLADPFVLVGAFMFAYTAYITKTIRIQWINKHVPLIVFVSTALITFGYIHGLISFGSNSWASVNRFFGWFVVLSYAATGALFVAHGQSLIASANHKDNFARLKYLTQILTLASVAIVATDIAFYVMRDFGVHIPLNQLRQIMEGFSNNANALSFILTIIFTLNIALFGRNKVRHSAPEFGWLVMQSLLLVGIAMTDSRTAYVIASVVVSLSLLTRIVRCSRICAIVIIAGSAFLLITSIPEIITFVYGSLVSAFNLVFGTNFAAIELLTDRSQVHLLGTGDIKSDTERLRSLIEGLNLWRDHIVFGAGLGAFIELGLLNSMGDPLVIHNAIIWVLAEFGLVGLALFGGCAVTIARSAAAPLKRLNARGKDWALILLLLIFVLANLPHEMVYQRIFWFILGALLIDTSGLTNKDTDHRHSGPNYFL